MSQTQEEAREPLAVFSSFGMRGTVVGISKQDFGYQLPEQENATPDEFAAIHWEPSGEGAGFRAISFAPDGRYAAFIPGIRDCLRKHQGNRANGGSDFMEVPKEVVRQGRELSGAVGATMPEGGLTDLDHVLLQDMYRYSVKVRAPKALAKPRRTFTGIVERFRVTGARAPLLEDKPGKVKVRFEDLAEILAAAGIAAESANIPLDPTEIADGGRGNT